MRKICTSEDKVMAIDWLPLPQTESISRETVRTMVFSCIANLFHETANYRENQLLAQDLQITTEHAILLFSTLNTTAIEQWKRPLPTIKLEQSASLGDLVNAIYTGLTTA